MQDPNPQEALEVEEALIVSNIKPDETVVVTTIETEDSVASEEQAIEDVISDAPTTVVASTGEDTIAEAVAETKAADEDYDEFGDEPEIEEAATTDVSEVATAETEEVAEEVIEHVDVEQEVSELVASIPEVLAESEPTEVIEDEVIVVEVEKEIDSLLVQTAIDNQAAFNAEIQPAVAASILDTITKFPEGFTPEVDLDEGDLIDEDGLPVLHVHQQITCPTSVKVGETSYPVYGSKFTSDDESAATVTETGLVTRVEYTAADYVTIQYTAAFDLDGYGKVDLSDTIKYRVFQFNPVDLDLDTKEV